MRLRSRFLLPFLNQSECFKLEATRGDLQLYVDSEPTPGYAGENAMGDIYRGKLQPKQKRERRQKLSAPWPHQDRTLTSHQVPLGYPRGYLRITNGDLDWGGLRIPFCQDIENFRAVMGIERDYNNTVFIWCSSGLRPSQGPELCLVNIEEEYLRNFPSNGHQLHFFKNPKPIKNCP